MTNEYCIPLKETDSKVAISPVFDVRDKKQVNAALDKLISDLGLEEEK